jgi:hypothetical protein
VPQENFCIDSMLKHCAANRNRRLSELPNVDPYIYDVKISGFTRNSIYIYDISRLGVNFTFYVTSSGGEVNAYRPNLSLLTFV